MFRKLFVMASTACCLALTGLLLLSGGAVQAQGADQYVPDTMSYQGYLTDSEGQPLDGIVDLYFGLWDGAEDGELYWEEYHDGVEVNGGYFYVLLGSAGSPLGYDAYSTNHQWIGVYMANPTCRPGCTKDDPAFEKLPRQKVATAPYAIKAGRAYSATWASKVKWDGIVGKPDQVGGGYKYVVTVAKEGGDYASIYDAVESITDANAENRYLIHVAPGFYVETQPIVLKPWITLQGAGQHATYIDSYEADKTIILRNNTSIHDLTVRNYYPGGNSYALYANHDEYEAKPVWLYDIRAYASAQNAQGDYNHYGIYAYGDVELKLYDVHAYGEYGPTGNYGAWAGNGAKLYLYGGAYYGHWGENSYGIYSTGEGTELYGEYSKAWGRHAMAANYGYYNDSGARAWLDGGDYYGAYGEGSGQYCYGIYNNSWLNTQDANGYANGCPSFNYGLFNRYGNVVANGGEYRAWVTNTGGAEQRCYGIYTGDKQGETYAEYKGYGVRSWADSCYSNFGLYNYDGGQAWLERSTHYAEGTQQNYGAWCGGPDSFCWSDNSHMWGRGGANNYGYYNASGSQSRLDLSHLAAFCGTGGCNKWSVYVAGGNAWAGNSKFDDLTPNGYSVQAGGNLKCYGVYNSSYDAVACVQP